jgi:hypothetical protein
MSFMKRSGNIHTAWKHSTILKYTLDSYLSPENSTAPIQRGEGRRKKWTLLYWNCIEHCAAYKCQILLPLQCAIPIGIAHLDWEMCDYMFAHSGVLENATLYSHSLIHEFTAFQRFPKRESSKTWCQTGNTFIKEGTIGTGPSSGGREGRKCDGAEFIKVIMNLFYIRNGAEFWLTGADFKNSLNTASARKAVATGLDRNDKIQQNYTEHVVHGNVSNISECYKIPFPPLPSELCESWLPCFVVHWPPLVTIRCPPPPNRHDYLNLNNYINTAWMSNSGLRDNDSSQVKVLFHWRLIHCCYSRQLVSGPTRFLLQVCLTSRNTLSSYSWIRTENEPSMK